jgi:hypothetical protein
MGFLLSIRCFVVGVEAGSLPAWSKALRNSGSTPDTSTIKHCYVRARIDVANGPCRGCTHKPMRLLASRRENLQAVSQEQSRTVIWRLAPRRRALWKLKPDLMGAVVQYRMAEVGGITRLACLMEKREKR